MCQSVRIDVSPPPLAVAEEPVDELVQVGENDIRRIARGIILIAGIHDDSGFSTQDLLAQRSDDLLDPFSLILQ